MMPRMKAQAEADSLKTLKAKMMAIMSRSPEACAAEPELAEALGVDKGESYAEDGGEMEASPEESPIKAAAREAMAPKPKAPKRPGTAIMIALGNPGPKAQGKRGKAY